MSIQHSMDELAQIKQSLHHLGYQAEDRFVTGDWRQLQQWLEVVIVSAQRLPKPFSGYVRAIDYQIGSLHVDLPPRRLCDLWHRLNLILRRQVAFARCHVVLEELVDCQEKVRAGADLSSMCRHLILRSLGEIKLPETFGGSDPHWYGTELQVHLRRLQTEAAQLDSTAPGRANMTDTPPVNAAVEDACAAWRDAKADKRWPLQ
ncbi:MAG TPA: hypothetical protein VED40_23075 [Azospirillaceae bacterium]|nr:hypothetical protein [Azospirillaceae bacterium]